MKKFISLLLLSSLPLSAQTGESAVEAAEVAQSSDWQNWTFAAVAIVTAAVGVYVVSVNSGHSAN